MIGALEILLINSRVIRINSLIYDVLSGYIYLRLSWWVKYNWLHSCNTWYLIGFHEVTDDI